MKGSEISFELVKPNVVVCRFCSSNTRLYSILNCEFHSCQDAYLTGQHASPFSLALRLSPFALCTTTGCFPKKSIWLHYLPSLVPQWLSLSSQIRVLKWSWPSSTNPSTRSSKVQAQNTTSSHRPCCSMPLALRKASAVHEMCCPTFPPRECLLWTPKETSLAMYQSYPLLIQRGAETLLTILFAMGQFWILL